MHLKTLWLCYNLSWHAFKLLGSDFHCIVSHLYVCLYGKYGVRACQLPQLLCGETPACKSETFRIGESFRLVVNLVLHILQFEGPQWLHRKAGGKIFYGLMSGTAQCMESESQIDLFCLIPTTWPNCCITVFFYEFHWYWLQDSVTTGNPKEFLWWATILPVDCQEH